MTETAIYHNGLKVWQLIFTEQGGHKVFKTSIDGVKKTAIADQSGFAPDQTDDGILWIEQRHGEVNVSRHGLTVRVFPERTPGEWSWVPISEGLAYWLTATMGYKLMLSPQVEITTGSNGVAVCTPKKGGA